MIDVSGVHIEGRTDESVTRVLVSETANLTEIPTIIFSTFENLEVFTVSSNNVRRIYLPYCGPRVREVSINYNSIPLLQNGAFRGCRSIEILQIIGNDHERIEENVFDDLPMLHQLIMFNNTIVEIQGHWLRYQHQLEVLRLDRSTITSIQPSSFQCKDILFFLGLRDNRLERIATGTFTNMLSLRELDLGTNLIHVIEEGAFANLPLLQRLHLVGNQIVVLDSKFFGTSFPNLQHLDLGSNQINAVDVHAFTRFPALRTMFGDFNICFSYNFFVTVSIEADVFPYLETCFINFENLLKKTRKIK